MDRTHNPAIVESKSLILSDLLVDMGGVKAS